MHENIHVLTVHVNKFSWVPHRNILKRKFCQVEITVHVLLIKQLLATYIYLFLLLQRQLNVVKPTQYTMHKPFTMDSALGGAC